MIDTLSSDLFDIEKDEDRYRARAISIIRRKIDEGEDPTENELDEARDMHIIS